MSRPTVTIISADGSASKDTQPIPNVFKVSQSQLNSRRIPPSKPLHRLPSQVIKTSATAWIFGRCEFSLFRSTSELVRCKVSVRIFLSCRDDVFMIH
jgi:hypothetical protein